MAALNTTPKIGINLKIAVAILTPAENPISINQASRTNPLFFLKKWYDALIESSVLRLLKNIAGKTKYNIKLTRIAKIMNIMTSKDNAIPNKIHFFHKPTRINADNPM